MSVWLPKSIKKKSKMLVICTIIIMCVLVVGFQRDSGFLVDNFGMKIHVF